MEQLEFGFVYRDMPWLCHPPVDSSMGSSVVHCMSSGVPLAIPYSGMPMDYIAIWHDGTWMDVDKYADICCSGVCK